jgi:hypothetical protein
VKRCRLLALMVILAPAALARAQETAEGVSPQTDRAIAEGLAYLARQQHSDGSLDGGGPKVAMTGLSLMSFLASGHVADEGGYGLNVRGAVDFLVRSEPEDGYFGKVDASRMYGQGIATLALAEAYGVESDPARRKRIRAAVERAVKLILDAQAVAKADPFAGGWRYEPTSADSDLSLSGWNALALRAAQDAGVTVGRDRVKEAVGFVMRCYKADEHGFGYQPGNAASISMTGVGILNWYLLDGGEDSRIDAAGKYLLEHPAKDDTRMECYATYYAAQAAFQVGGEVWKGVWKATEARLTQEQEKDGSWPPSHETQEPGRVYSTSMALLTLSAPYRLAPIYQR